VSVILTVWCECDLHRIEVADGQMRLLDHEAVDIEVDLAAAELGFEVPLCIELALAFQCEGLVGIIDLAIDKHNDALFDAFLAVVEGGPKAYARKGGPKWSTALCSAVAYALEHTDLDREFYELLGRYVANTTQSEIVPEAKELCCQHEEFYGSASGDASFKIEGEECFEWEEFYYGEYKGTPYNPDWNAVLDDRNFEGTWNIGWFLEGFEYGYSGCCDVLEPWECNDAFERSPLEGEPDGRFGLVIFDGGVSIAYQQTYATEAEATAAGEYLDTWFRLVYSDLDNTDVSLIVLRAVVDDPDPELATVKEVWSGEPPFEEYEAKVVISADWRDVDASDDEDEDEDEDEA